MQTKSILKHLNLMNTLLMAVLAAFSIYIVFPLLNTSSGFTPPATKKTAAAREEKTAPPQTPSIAEYAAVAEQNIFHPERNIPAAKAEAPQLPKPDFVLYGTLITDGMSMAYIEDLKTPSSTPGRGKRQTVLKKGDAMSGFTLKAVEADKVVMARGEEQLTVSLNDPQKPKARDSSAPASPQKPQAASQQQTAAPDKQPSLGAQIAPPSAPEPPAQKTTGQQPAAAPDGKRNVMFDFFRR